MNLKKSARKASVIIKFTLPYTPNCRAANSLRLNDKIIDDPEIIASPFFCTIGSKLAEKQQHTRKGKTNKPSHKNLAEKIS